jgi:hypothetical protein
MLKAGSSRLAERVAHFVEDAPGQGGGGPKVGGSRVGKEGFKRRRVGSVIMQDDGILDVLYSHIV